MRILFVGPNVSEYAQVTHHGDVAAARWSYSLLKALSAHHEITVLTHIHERPWPLGECFWRGRDERYLRPDWPCVNVSYPAIYKFRWKYLAWAYPRAARKLFKKQKFDAVLLYNCLYDYETAVMREAKRAGVPSFPIILDGDDPRRDNWAKLLRDTQDAKGVIFLSYWAAQHYPSSKPRLHLDGGAEEWLGVPPKIDDGQNSLRIHTFVHTGSLDKWRGLGFMQQVAHQVDEQKLPVRIVLCGRILPEMRDAFTDCRCIEMKGFMSDDALKQTCLECDGFLNVRDPNVGDNILNYPSKIPHCLSYGKPVVSTWIDSFSPDYREVMIVDKGNSPETFVQAMHDVIKMNFNVCIVQYDVIKNWFEKNKYWSVQAKRLSDWIQGVK